MSIPFPSIRRPSQVSWALRALTQAHTSPLDGTTQTLRQPGERWAASVSWPTLGDADRRVLEAFLAQMGGRAGRFFYGPPHAARRAVGTGVGRTNWLANSTWTGAAVGVTPPGWTLDLGPGATGSVTGAGTDANGAWIDVTFGGTPTGVGICVIRPFFAAAAATTPGTSWTGAVTVQTIGGFTNIGQIRPAVFDATGTSYGTQTSGTGNPAGISTPTRRSVTRAVTTSFAGFGVDIRATTGGSPASLTLRLYQPHFNEGATAQPFIPTSTGPVTVFDPPVINGAGQSGSVLSTRAWAANADAMRAGDYLSYTDTLGRRRLHIVTADTVANASGIAALPIAPPIRRAGVDGAAIEIVNPTGVFMLASDEVGVATRPPTFGSVSLEMVEALV